MNYASLSEHLNKKLSENTISANQIDEGFFNNVINFFGKNRKTDENTSKKEQGFLGALGSLIKNLTQVNAPTDKLLQKYEKIEQDRLKSEQDRLKNELAAEEEREIARLDAQYAQEKNQLDIASQRRVDMYRAHKKQLEDVTKKISSNTLLYSSEQNAQILNNINNLGRDLNVDESSDAMKMRELATLILCREDGTVRSQKEIEAEAANNPELQDYIAEYNRGLKNNESEISTSIDSDAYKEILKHNADASQEAAKAKTNYESAKTISENYNKNVDAVKQIKAMKDAYDTAKTDVETAEAEVNKIKDDSKNNAFVGKIKGNTVQAVSSKDYKKALAKILNDDKYVTGADGAFDYETFKNDLIANGVNEDIISKIDSVANDPNRTEIPTAPSTKTLLNDAINNISDKDYENAANAAKNTLQDKLNAATAKAESAKQVLNDTIDPTSKEGQRKINAGNNEAIKNALKTYNSIPEKDITSDIYNPDTTAGAEYAKQVKTALATAEKSKKQFETNTATNAAAVKGAKASRKIRKEFEMDPDLRDAVDANSQSIEGGETFNKDGKIGIKIKDKDGKEKFLEKPGPTASREEQDEYINAREELLISQNPAFVDSESLGIKSVVKNENGTYTIEYADGTKTEDASLQKAAIAKSNQIAVNRSRDLIIRRKQEVAEALTGCIVNVKLDEEKYNALDPKNKAAIKKILSGDREIGSYFENIDFDGASDTAKQMQELLKPDVAKQIAKDLDGIDADFEYSKPNKKDEDWDDTYDENSTDIANDDNEYESEEEDTDNAKDTDNNELVKGEDGKWYKKKEDGSADIESGEKTNVSKKPLKNPAKKYHKRKNKRTGKTTKNYYDKDGNSVNQKEYDDMVANYRKARKRAQEKGQTTAESIIYTNLTNYLFEKLK